MDGSSSERHSRAEEDDGFGFHGKRVPGRPAREFFFFTQIIKIDAWKCGFTLRGLGKVKSPTNIKLPHHSSPPGLTSFFSQPITGKSSPPALSERTFLYLRKFAKCQMFWVKQKMTLSVCSEKESNLCAVISHLIRGKSRRTPIIPHSQPMHVSCYHCYIRRLVFCKTLTFYPVCCVTSTGRCLLY